MTQEVGPAVFFIHEVALAWGHPRGQRSDELDYRTDFVIPF